MKVDIFCHVIDFWGDIAVSWRCAKALKLIRPDWEIRYFCDNWVRWHDLFGRSNHTEIYDGIVLKDFLMGVDDVADIAVACLSCDLPQGYKTKQCFINLEYFILNTAVIAIHKQRSFPNPHYFFVPGIFEGTGGLIFGNFLQKSFLRDDLYQSRNLFCKKKDLSIDISKTWISCYLYDCDWERVQVPNHVVIIGPARLGIYHKVKNQYFLNLTLEEYDELLWLCDQHYIRGEDSLSRAILTGKPFLWQAYQEDSDAHYCKIMTLLKEIFLKNLDNDVRISNVYKDLNEKKSFKWSEWDWVQENYKQNFERLTQRVLSLGSQEENLVIFIEDLLKNSQFHP